jgi:hypothetical protein
MKSLGMHGYKVEMAHALYINLEYCPADRTTGEDGFDRLLDSDYTFRFGGAIHFIHSSSLCFPSSTRQNSRTSELFLVIG